MAEMLVVKSKIKEAAKGMNVAGNFAEALNKEVHELVADACRRSKANGRKTIKPDDL